MDKLKTLFTAIGDLFTDSSWFDLVQWPFWTFLFLIAVGGVYTARFQKNTLFCRGAQGVLKLTMVYMTTIAGYYWLPSFMETVAPLPFLSATTEALTLGNPLDLFNDLTSALPRELVQLYFLLLLINAVGTFDYNGKNPLVWIGLQILTCAIPVGAYKGLGVVILDLWPLKNDWLFLGVGVVFLAVAAVMLLAKLIFLVTKKTGNHAYSVAYQFFTVQRIGSLFTSSLVSLLIVLVFLIALHLFEHSRILLTSFNPAAFWLVGFLGMISLAIYNTLFTERKP